VAEDYRFDERINLTLTRDEAIVLGWYLERELVTENEKNLRASFIHPAEAHSLHGLLQELYRSSDDIDQIAGIGVVAREHLLKRHT